MYTGFYLVNHTKPYNIFLSGKNIWQKSEILLLIDKLKIPSQTGKPSLPNLWQTV